MYRITKRFTFEASHRLILDYESPCSSIHGHSYKVEVSVSSPELDRNGMVLDFSELKVIKNWIDENWDHALLLSIKDSMCGSTVMKEQKTFIFDKNVTAENMCKMIVDLMQDIVRAKLPFEYTLSAKIWETENNFAEYTAGRTAQF